MPAKKRRRLSKVTREDCESAGRLGIDIRCLFDPAQALYVPAHVSEPEISDILSAVLTQIVSRTKLINEASKSSVIQALVYAAADFANGKLAVRFQTRLYTTTKEAIYNGATDYSLEGMDSDSSLLVVEAKSGSLDESAVFQTVAQAACLQRKSFGEGRESPVFAVLTNGTVFRFFVLKKDGVLLASHEHWLELHPRLPWKQSNTLIDIMKWFHWMVQSITVLTPRASAVHLTRRSARLNSNHFDRSIGN